MGTMINSIRNYFIDCPLMENRKINVDYLGLEANQFTIDITPTETVLTRYADGGALKQYIFTIGSREYYNADVINNIENSGFYEVFSAWIEEQNNISNLPVLPLDKQAMEIETTTSGYLFGVDEDTARYQIQLRLTYYEDK